MEGVELSVVGDVPLFSQARSGLQIGVEVHHRRVEIEIDLPVVDALRHDGIERRDLPLETADDSPPLLGLLEIVGGRDGWQGPLVGACANEKQEQDEALHSAIIGITVMTCRQLTSIDCVATL